jgi:hexulose-6-phosphate isomerase
MNEDMTRRGFAGLVATGAAAAAMGGAWVPAGRASVDRTEHEGEAAAGGVRVKRTLRKAVMIGMVAEGKTLAEKCAIVREAGFEGMEIDSPTELDLDELKAGADKAGLVLHGAVNSTHWSVPLNVPDEAASAKALGSLETCLRDAKKVGASSILLVPGVVNADLAYDECWRRSVEVIRRAMPLAKELGVVIAIENVWNGFLLSPLEAARYVDEFGDPIVRWHFDIGNVINFGWPEQWVKVLGSRIVKIHIKDFSRKKRDNEGLWKGFAVEVGEGDAGWARVMAALDACGYSTAAGGNWATAEVRGGDLARLRRIREQMDTVLAM